MLLRFFRRLHYLLNRRRYEAELAEEMAFHRALTDGRTFGNATLAREDARDTWTWRWLEQAAQDTRHAVRSMWRNPAFALIVITIVAVGTGAATCVFALLDALVIRSLPVDRPERLVWLEKPAFSYPVFREVQARTPVFDNSFGWNIDRAHVDWSGRRGELLPTDVLEVTSGFFPTLRVRPAVGRAFGPDDAAVAVISHRAWRRHFGADPAVIGRTLLVDDVALTIVGVSPAGFSGVAPGLDPEVIVPISARYGAADSIFTTPSSSWLHIMARVKDGISLAQAEAAFQAAWPAVLEATTNANMPANRRAMYLGRTTSLQSGRAGFSRVRNRYADPLWLLMVLVGVLLAIACASVANLLLARGMARRREIAVRLAIGAGRTRVFRQLLTESLVLTLSGAAAGLLLATWAAAFLVSYMQTSRDQLVIDTSPEWRTIGFTLATAVIVSMMSALLPAVHALRRDVHANLKETAGSTAGFLRRWSAGKALVGLQVALAVILVCGAAVFGRSLMRVLAQDIGVDAARVLVVAPNAGAAGYTGAAQTNFDLAVLDRLRAAPGVESASVSWFPPISNNNGNWTQSIAIDGGPLQNNAPYVYFNGVSPGYFRTVGMRLRRGRDLADTDSAGSPRVAVINESLARQFFPGQDAVGRQISIGRAANRKDLEIVGIVQDAKYRSMQEPQRNIAYLSIAQIEDVTSGRDLFIEVRATDLASAATFARTAVRELDARVPVHVETIADRVRESTLLERMIAILAAALGAAALVLACAGLYGLLGYAVSRHSREIALRIALGAGRGSVLWMVQRESIALAVLGVAAGLAGALALARFVSSALLFQIAPTDPVALTFATLLMLAVAAAAAYVPARRAASVDPIVTLKADG